MSFIFILYILGCLFTNGYDYGAWREMIKE